MSLADWKAGGWLVEHKPTRDETRALLGVIDRDLRDSEVAALSPDTQLALAYKAALQAGTIALAAHGNRGGAGTEALRDHSVARSHHRGRSRAREQAGCVSKEAQHWRLRTRRLDVRHGSVGIARPSS